VKHEMQCTLDLFHDELFYWPILIA